MNTLHRTPNGASLGSNDEVHMVAIHIVDILRSVRSVFYPNDLPGVEEALRILGDTSTAVLYMYGSRQKWGGRHLQECIELKKQYSCRHVFC